MFNHKLLFFLIFMSLQSYADLYVQNNYGANIKIAPMDILDEMSGEEVLINSGDRYRLGANATAVLKSGTRYKIRTTGIGSQKGLSPYHDLLNTIEEIAKREKLGFNVQGSGKNTIIVIQPSGMFSAWKVDIKSEDKVQEDGAE
jgi:hypothetical protein